LLKTFQRLLEINTRARKIAQPEVANPQLLIGDE
jgi:hypothetical protein